MDIYFKPAQLPYATFFDVPLISPLNDRHDIRTVRSIACTLVNVWTSIWRHLQLFWVSPSIRALNNGLFLFNLCDCPTPLNQLCFPQALPILEALESLYTSWFLSLCADIYCAPSDICVPFPHAKLAALLQCMPSACHLKPALLGKQILCGRLLTKCVVSRLYTAQKSQ